MSRHHIEDVPADRRHRVAYILRTGVGAHRREYLGHVPGDYGDLAPAIRENLARRTRTLEAVPYVSEAASALQRTGLKWDLHVQYP